MVEIVVDNFMVTTKTIPLLKVVKVRYTYRRNIFNVCFFVLTIFSLMVALQGLCSWPYHQFSRGSRQILVNKADIHCIMLMWYVDGINDTLFWTRCTVNNIGSV